MAQSGAKSKWTSLAQATHGKAYADLSHASAVRWSCKGAGVMIGCTLSARPCGVATIKYGK